MKKRRGSILSADTRKIIGTWAYGATSTATLYDDGVFEVKGTGSGYDYTYQTQPWASYRSLITQVIFDDRITRLGDCVFMGCENLVSISLPSTLPSISEYSFYACINLGQIILPSSLSVIGRYAFSGCKKLEFTVLPSSLTSIWEYSFASCEKLSILKFYGTPSIINISSFSACSYITDIYVPWSEGEVVNAPWGATNATIHYNYVPEY